jgi:hypothetical protein
MMARIIERKVTLEDLGIVFYSMAVNHDLTENVSPLRLAHKKDSSLRSE